MLAEEAFLADGADLSEEGIARTSQELKSDNPKTTNPTAYTEQTFPTKGAV